MLLAAEVRPISPPKIRTLTSPDGHFLHPRLSASIRRPQTIHSLPLREPHHRKSRLRSQDIIHVPPPSLVPIARSSCLSRSFVGILFVDALQRMIRVTAELESARADHTMHDARTESTIAARKF